MTLHRHSRWTGLCLVSMALTLAGCASLQRPSDRQACHAQALSAEDLVGAWQVTLLSEPVRHARLDLYPHPDYPGSLRGDLHWPQGRLAVAADLEGTALTLEESEDGRRISATWVGELVLGHCGRRIEGQRLGNGGADTQGPAFRLQRD